MTWSNLEGSREDLGVTRKDPGDTRENLERIREDLEGTRKDLEVTWEDLESTRRSHEESAKETQEDLVVFWGSALAQHRPGFLESVSEGGRAAQRLGGICWAVQRKVSYKVEL